MNQSKLKNMFGIAGIVLAVVAIALFFVGALAIDFDTAAFVKIMVFVIAVLCLALAAELIYMYTIENESAPNYFLYNSKTKKNIPANKLNFQIINTRMNRYLSGYATSEGKLWTDKIFDNPYLEVEEKFKPAIAYKLLYDLAEKDTELAWKCFELASEETVEYLCSSLEMNYDMDMARALRHMKGAVPFNAKAVRDYLVKNRNYLKGKLCRYIYDNIQMF